jgi:hypothetical protein
MITDNDIDITATIVALHVVDDFIGMTVNPHPRVVQLLEIIKDDITALATLITLAAAINGELGIVPDAEQQLRAEFRRILKGI